MKRIILITGGQRSGKSQYAERLALSLSPNPVYVATAHIWDDEFRQRVEKHQNAVVPNGLILKKRSSSLDMTSQDALLSSTVSPSGVPTSLRPLILNCQLSTVNCQLFSPPSRLSLTASPSKMPLLSLSPTKSVLAV